MSTTNTANTESFTTPLTEIVCAKAHNGNKHTNKSPRDFLLF